MGCPFADVRVLWTPKSLQLTVGKPVQRAICQPGIFGESALPLPLTVAKRGIAFLKPVLWVVI
jgi:hypothetical protein